MPHLIHHVVRHVAVHRPVAGHVRRERGIDQVGAVERRLAALRRIDELPLVMERERQRAPAPFRCGRSPS